MYAILALSVLIIVHEFGHFLAAKATGMHVDTFSVLGIGPVVLRLGEWRGTEFVISAIPFGAYVQIVGMEPEEDENDPKLSDEERAEIKALNDAARERAESMGYQDYRDRPAWAQALTLFGGPFANYIAAMVIACAVFVSAGMPAKTGILEFSDCDSPARMAGLEPGDVFVSVAGEPVTAQTLNEVTGAHLGETIDVVVDRGGEQRTFAVTLNEQLPALQTQLDPVLEPIPAGTALSAGVMYPISMTAVQLQGLGRMVTGRSKGNVGGPVEIVRQMKNSASMGAADFFLFAALISTVLGMFNLLPVPALDGGRLVFVGWNALFKRLKVNPHLEATIHGYGLLVLMAFLLYATWGDIRRLRGGGDEAEGECPPITAPASDEAADNDEVAAADLIRD